MIKKILFFFPENPFSNRAGNVTRAKTNLTILKLLGYQIDLVGIEDMYKVMEDDTEFDKNVVDNLFLLARRPLKKITSLEYWRYKFSTSKYKSPSNKLLTGYIKESFKKILEAKKYDYVVINYEFWAGLIDDEIPNNSVKIVDTHDWITLNEFYKNPTLKIGERFEEEINNLAKFDKIITVSNDENFVFKGFLGDKVINIPPSFPSHFLSGSEKRYDLIFVGSDNIFNIKSIQWFFEKVHILLPENIKIVIIGRVCRHLEKVKNVEYVEFAETLDEYYYQSKIAICPMLEGTGIKIKVIEALSYGLPIVGTERAIDGFASKSSNGCLVDNRPEIFKDHIISLLQNDTFYQNTKSQAEEYFKNNFTEEKAVEKWKNILM
ncbi:glycosyltransferase [Chryseobacterium chendengshani]|uniref:glycosyltransferase n=1 Tax=Chryseobacterium sp. LJ756 TaxID=2864113 RepID=UPI001C641CDB|nr:glycosyltransferase [Chryseobacterium sp. LJ756]MBW7675743.1 glycosyltransferase family 4 protein [Chryseobacterium sp. LJ756]